MVFASRFAPVLLLLVALVSGCTETRPPAPASAEEGQNWTHYVRIGGHPLSIERADSIVTGAEETYVYGIETDNDITGRYASFLDPEEKLEAIRAVAGRAHEAGNRAFVYIAGLECITENPEALGRSFFQDHPDWVQRDVTGRPAIFGAEDAFWIDEGEEDVWISPYAQEWRELYMERVRQIAATGIDGVYVDIPYWMTHFEGWTDTWASFDEHTVAAFREETGLEPPGPEQLGDFGDPTFRAWVDFRIRTLTDFMAEIDDNVKAVDPEVMTIAEIYPGLGDDAVRVGADVYQMYEVVDAIAHEYSAGAYMAAARQPADWFTYMTGMHSFRAFAGDKAAWMLSYSWDGQEDVSPQEAMENLAMSHVMAGVNTWDAHTHVMSGSNDYDTRRAIFAWIEQNQAHIYRPRRPMRPVGVYFSPSTRNYFADAFVAEYAGLVNLLQQAHVEFQVVTPRTLADFDGSALVLPDVRILSGDELDQLQRHYGAGRRLVVTGETGRYGADRQPRNDNPVLQMLDVEASEQAEGKQFVVLPDRPGAAFMEALRENYDEHAVEGTYEDAHFYEMQQAFVRHLGTTEHPVHVEASPFVATQITEVDGRSYVYVANFKGLQGEVTARQQPETGSRVTFASDEVAQVYALPFLGEVAEVPAERTADGLTAELPPIEKGMIVWAE